MSVTPVYTFDGAVERCEGSLVALERSAEHAGDAGLHVVGGRVEVLADLGHQTGREVPQGPVVVQLGPHAQLAAHDTRRY